MEKPARKSIYILISVVLCFISSSFFVYAKDSDPLLSEEKEPFYDKESKVFYANGTAISISGVSNEDNQITWIDQNGKKKSQTLDRATTIYAGSSLEDCKNGSITMGDNAKVKELCLGGEPFTVSTVNLCVEDGEIEELNLKNSCIKNLEFKQGNVKNIVRDDTTVLKDTKAYYFDNVVSYDMLTSIGLNSSQLSEYVSVWLNLGNNGELKLYNPKGYWSYSEQWFYLGAVPSGYTIKEYITEKFGAKFYESICKPIPYKGCEFTGWKTAPENGVAWNMDDSVIKADGCYEESVRLKDTSDELIPEKTLNIYAEWKVNYKRLYGQTRYETAYRIADEIAKKKTLDQLDGAIVAYGQDYPDALSGSCLSKATGYPILLVDSRNEDEVISQIYSDIKTDGKIYILGGLRVVSREFEESLSENFQVKRLQGKTRYETNIQILKETDKLSDDIRDLTICTGNDFADCLSVSAVGSDILIVDKSLTADQKAYISNKTRERNYIIGGEKAISNTLQKSYDTLIDDKSIRVGGKNRYETSRQVAETFFENPENGVVAWGENYPDGLSGAPLAMQIGAPLLLTSNNNYKDAVNYLNQNEMNFLYVLGGPSLISESLMNKLTGHAGKTAQSDNPAYDDIVADDTVPATASNGASDNNDTGTQLKAMNLDKVDKLMIVAHPDDESYWGGAHLLEDNYLVVCITNGDNSVRHKEFFNALQYSGDEGVILEYPDIKNGVKSKWQDCQKEIVSDLQKIIDYKDWSLIVTHNPDGEYGHIHHKITDKIVTSVCNTNGLSDKLFYFEQYYKASKVPNNFKSNLLKEERERKYQLAIKYPSQWSGFKNRYEVMQPYEYWVKATEWGQRDKMSIRVYTDTNHNFSTF